MPQPDPAPAPSPGDLPTPVLSEAGMTVYHGNALELLGLMPADSVDALVSDPPYGLSLGGQGWDDVSGFRASLIGIDTRAMAAPEVFETWCRVWAAGALHALKPGAYAAVFGGTRTWHRMARGLEDAGFEIRDQIAWLHTTGMPKSMDLSHALDKHHGVSRPDRSVAISHSDGVLGVTRSVISKGTSVTSDAQQWEGWGTALRPAFEPILIARKPPEGSIAQNLLAQGVGGINIDKARFADHRWPVNVAFDELQAEALDVLNGSWQSRSLSKRFPIFRLEHKPSAAERPRAYGVSHATVKPLALMRWLITLITPPGGLLLEPFAGSGTTIEAALMAGLRVLAIERNEEYLPLIQARLDRFLQSKPTQ